MASQFDVVVRNVHLAGVRDIDGAYRSLHDGAVGWRDGVLAYVGLECELPASSGAVVVDGGGGWLTPGLIDCHTHAVYGGSRAAEFEMRMRGSTYEEIAAAGGGILRTVRDTRAADEASLVAAARGHLVRLGAEGVTTVEIKSGYGLDTETELRMLRVARRLGEELPIAVVTTFLGAHAVPPEYRGRTDAYIDLVCEQMLPAVAAGRLADAVDVFAESIGFTVAQMQRVFAAARSYGLRVKAHAEQLSNLGAAVAAARQGAISVDHLEYLDPADAGALAAAGTVAVLLPGAFYSLRQMRRPPIAALRENGVAMAVATDLNPGTSPVASLLTAMNMACVFFELTPEEAFAGVTEHPACALGLSDRGVLAEGLRADCVLWPIDHPADLSYGINLMRPDRVWFGGREATVSGGIDVSAV